MTLDGDLDDYRAEVLRLSGDVNRSTREVVSLRSRVERLERREERRPAAADDWEENTDARIKKRTRVRRRDIGLTVSGVGGAIVGLINLIVWIVRALQH